MSRGRENAQRDSNEKKRASISLLLHLSLAEERKIAATELSITYELQPIRAEFLSEDKK